MPRRTSFAISPRRRPAAVVRYRRCRTLQVPHLAHDIAVERPAPARQPRIRGRSHSATANFNISVGGKMRTATGRAGGHHG